MSRLFLMVFFIDRLVLLGIIFLCATPQKANGVSRGAAR